MHRKEPPYGGPQPNQNREVVPVGPLIWATAITAYYLPLINMATSDRMCPVVLQCLAKPQKGLVKADNYNLIRSHIVYLHNDVERTFDYCTSL